MEIMGRRAEIWRSMKLINKATSKGKIKLSKKVTVNLTKSIENTISNSVVGLLDGVISKEEVVIDSKKEAVDIKIASVNQIGVKIGEVPTIIIPIPKKKAEEAFNCLDDGIVGTLLTTSTLLPIYKKMKKAWLDSNDETSPLTSIMYLPNICVFIDSVRNDYAKYYQMINVLFVGIPSKSVLEKNNDDEILNPEDYYARMIADIMDSAIKCGCDNLIFDPYAGKLANDLTGVSAIWKQILTSQRVIDHVNTVTLTLKSDSEFIIAKNNIL